MHFLYSKLKYTKLYCIKHCICYHYKLQVLWDVAWVHLHHGFPLSSRLSGKQTGRRSLPIYCSYMTEDSEEQTIPESYWILLTSTVTFNLLHHSHSHFMLHTGSEFLFNVNWYTCFIASHQMAKWRTWQQLWVEPQKMLFNHWGYPLREEETGHADYLADLIIQSSTYPMVTHTHM